ncbi:hypothetical protein MMC26_005994 [Xylographa opegraphella]|nr:hypothetical protein [Xylographa opegraphella]
MASESTPATVNGNYGYKDSYGTTENSLPITGNSANTTNGAASGQSATAATSNETSNSTDTNGSVSKDEVGWYFVEQYYTTLSRNPEKLHLFYSKRSQFVSGVEAEKVSVSVGQRAINERIKELDIQDCKVRVSNVDSQASFKNIVVQVIGEMSNKAAPHRKFVQTFVLAEQPNGYFVLNDIFRYIAEDEDEEAEDHADPGPELPVLPEPVSEPKTLTSSDDAAIQEQDAEIVDKKLEEEASGAQIDDSTVPATLSNGETSTASEVEEDTPVEIARMDENKGISSEEAARANTEIENPPEEAPKDPAPTPIATQPEQTTTESTNISTPAPVSKPVAPKTWANLVAARVPSTGAASTASAASVSPAPAQSKAPAAVSTAAVAAPAIPSSEDLSSQPLPSPGGWQTAGQDTSKRQARQQSNSVSGGASERGNILGYVKNVTERVDAAELKNTLNQYGKLEYFDVSRQKNCAFVEFADIAGYNAAVAANPHLIGGEQIYVEERRPRPSAYGGGYNNRGGMRGGRGGPDGRPNGQGRGGFQKDGGRGGYIPRGRGGTLTPRGRGMPQPA